MPNKILVRNPALNEWVWNILYNITPEQKSKLSAPFLRILKSSVRSKSFAEFSTLDEKVRLFSELGYDNAIVFFEDKAKSVNGLKVVLEKFEKDRQAAAAKDISHLKVFVSSDKQIKWLLSIMADTIHHKSYFLNLELNRIGHHLKSWKSQRVAPSTKELSESLDNVDLLVSTLLNALFIEDYVDGFLGLRPLDLKILLYLYSLRHTYIEKQKIWDYFAGATSKQRITSSMKRLYADNYVVKHVDLSLGKYCIASKGIESVNSYMQRVLKQNNF